MTIILKVTGDDADIQYKIVFNIIGEKRSRHVGHIIHSGSTIIFQPEQPFVLAETVVVQIGGLAKPFAFHFTTKADREQPLPQEALEKSLLNFSKESGSASHQVRLINSVAVPSDFPTINTTVHGVTGSGRIFFASTFFDTDSRSNYIVICENDGTPYFYRKYDRANLG
jgi:hypothetical protein